MTFLNDTTSINQTLADRLWPTAGNRVVRFIVLAIVGSLLLTLSAKIKVPFWPVHMTMQTCVVMLIGAAYGWRLGLATVVFYLAQGAAGLPVFTGTPEKGLGLAYMAGPTGGYLVGFAVAAAIVGWFAERGFDRSFFKIGGVMLAADVALFALGLLWLGTLVGWDKPVLAWGLYPFIAGDLFKIALAAAIVALGWRQVSRARGGEG